MLAVTSTVMPGHHTVKALLATTGSCPLGWGVVDADVKVAGVDGALVMVVSFTGVEDVGVAGEATVVVWSFTGASVSGVGVMSSTGAVDGVAVSVLVGADVGPARVSTNHCVAVFAIWEVSEHPHQRPRHHPQGLWVAVNSPPRASYSPAVIANVVAGSSSQPGGGAGLPRRARTCSA